MRCCRASICRFNAAAKWRDGVRTPYAPCVHTRARAMQRLVMLREYERRRAAADVAVLLI